MEPPNHYDDAISLILSGKREQARSILKEYIAIHPKDEIAWIWFIDSLATDEAREKAIELWRKMDPLSEVAQGGMDSYLKEIARLKYEYIMRVAAQSTEEQKKTDTESSEPEIKGEDNEQFVEEAHPEIPPEPPDGEEIKPQQEIQVLKRYRKPEKRKQKRLSILLILSMSFMLIAIAAVLIVGGQWLGIDLFAGFKQKPTCACLDTEAYLKRVNNRLIQWKTNQSLMLYSGSGVDLSGNIQVANQILESEKEDEIPGCLDYVHEMLLVFFDFHVSYAEALQAKDAKQADYYLMSQQIKQEELQVEFDKIYRELECDPE